MAVTKMHPIKSTLKKAIDYITNPDKTEGGLLVSSYGCEAPTADLEFALTAECGSGFGDIKAYHIIQAFEPGEVSPEEAHEIGKELLNKFLNGKYEYVLSTHVDKGHIHNHIIFNAVNFVDFQKFESEHNRGGHGRAYFQLRELSDKLCYEHNLSII